MFPSDVDDDPIETAPAARDESLDDAGAAFEARSLLRVARVAAVDEEAEQFKLFGTLAGAAYQLPMAATVAHSQIAANNLAARSASNARWN